MLAGFEEGGQDWTRLGRLEPSARHNSRAFGWCRAWEATQTRRRATEATRHVHQRRTGRTQTPCCQRPLTRVVGAGTSPPLGVWDMARARSRNYDPHWDLRHQASAARARAAAEARTVAAAGGRPGEIAHIVDSYCPRGVSDMEIAQFRDLMLPAMLAADLTPTAARRVLTFVSRVAIRMFRTRGSVTIEELLDRELVDHFFETAGRHYAQATRSRISSAITQLGRGLHLPDYTQKGTRYPRSEREVAYSAATAAAFYEAAETLVEPWRAEAMTLLDLSFGAGANSRQARDAKGDDVLVLDADLIGVRLTDMAGAERVRPVPHAVGIRLIERAREVGADGHLFRNGTERRNASYEVLVHLQERAPELGRFRVQRAADNWAVRALDLTQVMGVVETLGLAVTSYTLMDLLRSATRPPTAVIERLLASVPALVDASGADL